MSWLQNIQDAICCLKKRVTTLEGDSFDPTAPGPIGGTTPDEGNFTNMNVSGETVYYSGAIFSYADQASVESHLVELGLGTNDIITEATTTRTLALTDGKKYIRFTNAGAITLTIPTNAVVAIPIGTSIVCRRSSAAGAITLSFVGVTVNGSSIVPTIAAGANFGLKKIATDTWDVI